MEGRPRTSGAVDASGANTRTRGTRRTRGLRPAGSGDSSHVTSLNSLWVSWGPVCATVDGMRTLWSSLDSAPGCPTLSPRPAARPRRRDAQRKPAQSRAPALHRGEDRRLRLKLSTSPHSLLLLLMYCTMRSRTALLVDIGSNDVASDRPRGRSGSEPYARCRTRSRADSGPFRGRPFALQGSDGDHIMTTEGEPYRRRRSASRFCVSAQ